MQYVGLQRQISRNNRYSLLLLIAFPALLLGMLYIIIWVIAANSGSDQTYGDTYGYSYSEPIDRDRVFLGALPRVLVGVGIWFLIAYWGHTGFINRATGSKPLERKENMRVYNLVENLCIQQGIQMPQV